ncbi:type II toxin-antitoxin system ParD family antitoxin [Desulfovibrio sp. JC010]|uniref:type II toxin-antitoxin system ParD family antitoxin n=1 Tax=Desulfovibrio sp. JC010 TaxID=2593641 RepID=UPI0013D1C9CC|nr:type II toxin-antitoxin system ParD family antitoxin [Desulfovibrio sp. JC010]NDV28624.1 type II toxin-antitoxin system ParD family antitoxin [Desulfovibrio sp. JC010]
MPNVEKITIALTPELSALVKESVEQGDYASTSEVIRDALRDWKHKRALRDKEIEEIRKLWKEGIESGPGRFGSIDKLIGEAKNRLEDER